MVGWHTGRSSGDSKLAAFDRSFTENRLARLTFGTNRGPNRPYCKAVVDLEVALAVSVELRNSLSCLFIDGLSPLFNYAPCCCDSPALSARQFFALIFSDVSHLCNAAHESCDFTGDSSGSCRAMRPAMLSSVVPWDSWSTSFSKRNEEDETRISVSRLGEMRRGIMHTKQGSARATRCRVL
jgi:hypothetical protein